MKRCIREHFIAGVGVIHEGRLLDDDSPLLQKPEHFADASDCRLARPTRTVGGRVVELATVPAVETRRIDPHGDPTTIGAI